MRWYVLLLTNILLGILGTKYSSADSSEICQNCGHNIDEKKSTEKSDQKPDKKINAGPEICNNCEHKQDSVSRSAADDSWDLKNDKGTKSKSSSSANITAPAVFIEDD
ncbi:MAG: hypothetical protein LBB12_01990, partial [Holosporaceae bacterium]|nr:hypothetical protein [Holosporaceae bacterium]